MRSMKSKLGTPNKATLARWDVMQDIGCIACLKEGNPGVKGDVHHVLRAGRRVSHDHSLVLCSWHHRGVPLGTSAKETEKILGPSLARSKRDFTARYGTERELLELVDTLVEERRKLIR